MMVMVRCTVCRGEVATRSWGRAPDSADQPGLQETERAEQGEGRAGQTTQAAGAAHPPERVLSSPR